MKNTRVAAIIFILSILTVYLSGCGDKLLDPTQIGRFRPVPAVNVILESLGVAEETPSVWEGAEDPRPIDVMAYEVDYTFSPGDTVRIAIYELLQEDVTFINEYVVTETGKISIAEVGIVEAAGLTESQLEEEISDILSPGKIKEPTVTVFLLNSQQRTYSILGNGVPSPSRYVLPRYDFRLNDALATAGVATQFNISYIYVSRTVTGREAISEPVLEDGQPAPSEPEQLIVPEQEMLEIIAPRAQRQWPENKLIIASAEMITDKELAEMALPEDIESPDNQNDPFVSAEQTDRETIDEPINVQDKASIRWIFQDGKWVPIQIGIGQLEPTKPSQPLEWSKDQTSPLPPEFEQKVSDDFNWDQIGAGGVQTRVIKIPTDKLAGGDPKYNIVIRSGDTIHVPVDIIGGFYVYGNVNFIGYIDITGRPMTLKMAIAAAGGLGPLADPKRCEVVRRIGQKKEETIMVDLDKIASGEHPDFFIKPNDWVNVGTNPTARWRAVLRNAFRATYGFGFIYDRNFADRDYGTRRPIPNWF